MPGGSPGISVASLLALFLRGPHCLRHIEGRLWDISAVFVPRVQPVGLANGCQVSSIPGVAIMLSAAHTLPLSDCPAAHDLTVMMQTSPEWQRLQAGKDHQPSLRSPGGRSGAEASPHQPPPLSVRAGQRSACCAARSGAQDIGLLLVPHSGWCSEELAASLVQGGWVNESHHHNLQGSSSFIKSYQTCTNTWIQNLPACSEALCCSLYKRGPARAFHFASPRRVQTSRMLVRLATAGVPGATGLQQSRTWHGSMQAAHMPCRVSG